MPPTAQCKPVVGWGTHGTCLLSTFTAITAVIALAALWVAPILWVVGLSLKPNDVIMKTTGGLLFPPFTTKNYTDIIGTSAVFGWMLNSFIVATGQWRHLCGIGRNERWLVQKVLCGFLEDFQLHFAKTPAIFERNTQLGRQRTRLSIIVQLSA